jgi:hypothetical protein
MYMVNLIVVVVVAAAAAAKLIVSSHGHTISCVSTERNDSQTLLWYETRQQTCHLFRS